MAYPERVETNRLLLRRWEPADGRAMAAIWREPEVWSVMRPGAAYDPDHWRSMLDRQLEHWATHRFGLWAALDREASEVVGWIGAQHPRFIPQLADQVEVGWTLRPAFWGRGLATEGAIASIDTAFTHLDADEVISLIHPTNERSIAVATRLGMHHARDVLHLDLGEDLRVYALPRTGWTPNSNRGASPQSTSSR